MDLELVELFWAMATAALLLAFASVPLAVRRAGVAAWAAHGALALLLGAAVATAAHRLAFHLVQPWWQTAAAFLLQLSAPALATAWAARTAARRDAAGGGAPAVALAALAALVVSVAVGVRAASALLPEVVNAVE